MKIGICENQTEARTQLRRWIEQYCDLYGLALELLEYKRAQGVFDAMTLAHFDVIFLSADGQEGFLTARRMRELDSNVKLVFVTDTAQYAVMGVRLHLTDYIVKPMEFKHIVRAMRLLGTGGGIR